MQKIIEKLTVPKVILRYIMMNFTDMKTIENVILNVKIMNVLDDYSKNVLEKAKYGFAQNCENGHLDVAKWLYSLGNVDIHANNERAFRLSCKNGHLIVAKWLYSLGNVDIHAYSIYPPSEDAFQLSCSNGQLTVVQWLHSLGEEMDRTDTGKKQGGINIHADNEHAFKWACYFGHLAVAQWLYSLGNVDIHVVDGRYVSLSNRKETLDWLNTIGYF